MEIDGKADPEDITFKVPHISQPINIKDPDVEVGGEKYNYLVAFFKDADAALFAKDFTDPTSGYAKYIDVESFVDWYLINEITKNADAIYFTSCYMNLARGGKLKMGPLWDFDLAFGNYVMDKELVVNDPEGFWILEHVHWYIRLFEDPNFVQRVKERFNYFYSNREQIFSILHERSIYLKEYIYIENIEWQQLCNNQYTKELVLEHYSNESLALEKWLEHRFDWLKVQFSAM
ncbi:MAG: CotH kinase family protein [Bacteroidaceae bacterium]|nr:CotH kinase family protein [Bacteroidaceae bacterium]